MRTVIYDFDGTLFKSPTREEGELTYFQETGKYFPFTGWWGRSESLMPPVVPEKPGNEWFIENTVNAYQKDQKDKNTELILMTGRPFKNKNRVIEICNSSNLKFHKYYFRGQKGSKGKDTFEIKVNYIQNDLIHPNLQILEIWEDRSEHISAFIEVSKKWKSIYRKHLSKILIHAVPNGEKFEI